MISTVFRAEQASIAAVGKQKPKNKAMAILNTLATSNNNFRDPRTEHRKSQRSAEAPRQF
jgi:hypothetical protein